jgi:hypothetical protein
MELNSNILTQYSMHIINILYYMNTCLITNFKIHGNSTYSFLNLLLSPWTRAVVITYALCHWGTNYPDWICAV